MPARTLTAVDIIDLPALTANEAHTLAQSLENAARDDKGKLLKLPEAVGETHAELIDRRVALLAVLHGGGAADEAKVRPVDLRIDRIVSAMYRIIAAWTKLADELAEGETAAELVARLFPNGVQFINIAPREEWSEIESRLQAIKRESLEPRLAALGLTPVLDLLRVVHVEYGKVTGATAAPASTESAQVRTRKLELQDAIREHVAAIIGSVRKSKPETQKLADRLLAPLAEWESKAAKKGKSAGDAAKPDDKAPAVG